VEDSACVPAVFDDYFVTVANAMKQRGNIPEMSAR
jgi:hypothetical protein